MCHFPFLKDKFTFIIAKKKDPSDFPSVLVLEWALAQSVNNNKSLTTLSEVGYIDHTTPFSSGCDLRNIGHWSFHLFLWEWEVNHGTLQVLLISWKVKMAMSTHCCQNNLGLSSLSTMNSFPNGCSNGMSWFWSWYQPFRPCKLYSTCNQKTWFSSYIALSIRTWLFFIHWKIRITMKAFSLWNWNCFH